MSFSELQLGGLCGRRLQLQFARNQPACTNAGGISVKVGQGFMARVAGDHVLLRFDHCGVLIEGRLGAVEEQL